MTIKAVTSREEALTQALLQNLTVVEQVDEVPDLADEVQFILKMIDIYQQSYGIPVTHSYVRKNLAAALHHDLLPKLGLAEHEDLQNRLVLALIDIDQNMTIA